MTPQQQQRIIKRRSRAANNHTWQPEITEEERTATIRYRIVFALLLAAIIATLASCTHPDPPGVDPENYDYATPAELDSIWMVEAGGDGVFR